MRVKKEHSGSDDVVTKLKLEIQQLHEDSLLAKDLSTSRQHQNELLNAQIAALMAKIDAVAACSHPDL